MTSSCHEPIYSASSQLTFIDHDHTLGFPHVRTSKRPPGIARVSLLSGVSLLGYWLYAYQGGFATRPVPLPGSGSGDVDASPRAANDTHGLLNLHPLLMSIAFCLFLAEGVLAYDRSLLTRRLSHTQQKAVHAALNSLGVLTALAGAAAVVASKHLKQPERLHHFYSVHSIVGLQALTVALLQWSAGFSVFLLPFAPLALRRRLRPLHASLGVLTLGSGLLAISTGLQNLQSVQLQRVLSHAGPRPFETGSEATAAAAAASISWLPKAVALLLTGGLLTVYAQLVPGSPEETEQIREARQEERLMETTEKDVGVQDFGPESDVAAGTGTKDVRAREYPAGEIVAADEQLMAGAPASESESKAGPLKGQGQSTAQTRPGLKLLNALTRAALGTETADTLKETLAAAANAPGVERARAAVVVEQAVKTTTGGRSKED